MTVPPLNVSILTSLIVCVCSTSFVPQVAVDENAIQLHIEVSQGVMDRSAEEPVLLRGAPMEIVIYLGNALVAEAVEEHQRCQNDERSSAAREGRSAVVQRFRASEEDLVALPPSSDAWADFLTLVVVPLQEDGGYDEHPALGIEAFRSSIKEAVVKAGLPKKIGTGPATVHFSLPPGATSELWDGKFCFRADLDTRSTSDGSAWRGVTSTHSRVFEHRSPSSKRETLGVEYHLALYWYRAGVPSKALTHVKNVLSLDETFRDHEGYLVLAEVHAKLGDVPGEVSALEMFLDRVGARDDRAVLMARDRLRHLSKGTEK